MSGPPPGIALPHPTLLSLRWPEDGHISTSFHSCNVHQETWLATVRFRFTSVHQRTWFSTAPLQDSPLVHHGGYCRSGRPAGHPAQARPHQPRSLHDLRGWDRPPSGLGPTRMTYADGTYADFGRPSASNGGGPAPVVACAWASEICCWVSRSQPRSSCPRGDPARGYPRLCKVPRDHWGQDGSGGW